VDIGLGFTATRRDNSLAMFQYFYGSKIIKKTFSQPDQTFLMNNKKTRVETQVHSSIACHYEKSTQCVAVTDGIEPS
jgi:hypothetical protein